MKNRQAVIAEVSRRTGLSPAVAEERIARSRRARMALSIAAWFDRHSGSRRLP